MCRSLEGLLSLCILCILYLMFDFKYVCTARCWRNDVRTALSVVQCYDLLNKTFRSFVSFSLHIPVSPLCVCVLVSPRAHSPCVFLSPRAHSPCVFLSPRTRSPCVFISPMAHSPCVFLSSRAHSPCVFPSPRAHSPCVFWSLEGPLCLCIPSKRGIHRESEPSER